MPISEALKKAQQKYRESHKEKYRAYANVASKKYQQTHKQEVLAQKKEYYEIHKDEIKHRVLNYYYFKKENDIDEYFKTLRKINIQEF